MPKFDYFSRFNDVSADETLQDTSKRPPDTLSDMVTVGDNQRCGGAMTREMPDASGGAFSVRERRYLESLPAVRRVVGRRIYYTDWFKRECIRRYRQGESPQTIFSDAGLGSRLIGYKRIERCIARWKSTVKPDDENKSNGITGSDVTGDLDDTLNGATDMTGSMPKRVRHVGTYDGFGLYDGDVRDLIVAQQARRIDILERETRRLTMRINELICAQQSADMNDHPTEIRDSDYARDQSDETLSMIGEHPVS